MADEFDPYHRWLGIPPEEQPPHHYRLLGINAFEANPEVIRDAAQQRMAHVRTYQLGKSQALSQRILNELAAAKACLSDPQQKAAYDTQLRQKLAQPAKAPIPEVIKRIGNARLEQFVQHIMQSGLLSGTDISAHYEGLPPEKHPQDSQALARALVKANQLTKYQAELVYQGKIKGLAFENYRVLDKLGEGGMGMVFKAQHRRMKRLVAVKMILGAALKSPDAVKRFYREVEAAAQLQHPNIVTAYDASEYEGVHYLVMQFVDGKDLGAVVKERGPLPIAQAVDYIIQAARGLHYAHKQHIVHRDIKPANLLVDKEGTVKILDMGLARVAGLVDEEDKDRLTQSGQVMGTVDYMAPEQALDTHHVDARADIYSLGCTLYRLLAGEAVYKGETLAKVLIAHQMSPVPSLRNARNDAPPQLDAVFQKMVAKKPEDRYPTMAEVITALETCVSKGADPTTSVREEAPVVLPAEGNLSLLKTTVPPSAATATKKKAEPRAQATVSQHAAAADTSKQLESDEKPQPTPRKKKTLVIAVACGLLGVIGAVAFEVIIRIQRPDGTEQIIRAPQGSAVTVREDGSDHGKVVGAQPTAVSHAPSAPPRAVVPFDAAKAKQHQEAWAKHLPVHLELAAEPVAIKPRDALSEMALVVKSAPLDGVLSWTVETIGHRGDVLALEYSPDGRYLASAGYDGTIRLWNVATGKLHRALVGQNSLVAFVSWSPDSRLLAVASSDVMAGTAGGRASIWDVETGLIVRHDVAPQATAIQWSPDGRRIAYAKGKDVEIKDLASQSPQAMHLEGLTAGVEALAWSPDGGLLAAQTNQKNKKDKTFCIWDTHTGRLRQRIDPPKAGNANGRLAWSPDGTMLARGDLVSGEIWDVASAKLLHSFPQQAKSVAWSPDGRTVAFGLSSEPGGVKLHDAKSGNLLWQYVPEGPLGPAVAFSRDGQTVAAAGKSATILLLDAKSGRIRGSLGGHAFSTNGTIAFSPDSRQMVCSQPSDDPGVRFWDVKSGDLLSRWGPKADGAIFAWSQDAKFLAIASAPRSGPKTTGVWEMASQKCLRTVPGCGNFRDNLLLFPDGRTIATIEGDRQGKRNQQTTKFWDVGSGRAICAISGDGQGGFPVRSLSPDGKTLAITLGPRVTIYDPATGKAGQSLECPDKAAARALAWSADGKTLATAGMRSIDLWEMPLGRHVTHYTSPDGAREWRHGNTKSLCWRHDGTLAVGSCLGACVWDPTKRTVSHTIIGFPHDWVEQPCFFGPDGHLVAFLGQGLIRLCSLDDGRLRYTILNLKGDLHGVLRPDGHFSGSPGLEKELVYVVQTTHGQETFAPEEFATNYGWKSEPSKLGARNGQATATDGRNAPPPAVAPYDASQAKQRQEALANRLHVSVKTTNSIGMRFVLIPPGEFEMGSTPLEIAWALEQGRRNKEQQAHLDGVSGEGPRHRVKITKPFSLGACPVTQKEFSVVMGWNPSAYSAAGRFKRVVGSIDTGRHPVDMVSWEDAVEFCHQLSALPEEVAAHRTYRLPTEAEWEYACRAGNATRWWCGDDEAGLPECAWYQENARGMTHPVGEKKPNAWGLYDMYGNVRQWCADWFNKDYYQHSPPDDPMGPIEGTVRVLRGGAFSSMPLECCSASRYSSAPTGRSEHRGLRVVVEH